jgi:hypothetical protein
LFISAGWLNLVGNEVINELLEANVHIIWLVGNEASIKTDFSLFNQLLELKKHGVELHFHEEVDTAPFIAIDQSEVYEGVEGVFLSTEKEIGKKVDDAKQLLVNAVPFFSEDDDLSISFNASNLMIYAGDEIVIDWEVENANSVELIGVGAVDRLGRKSFRLGDDSVFKLKAVSDLQKAYATLFVGVNKSADIDYELAVLNKRSQRYDELVKSDHSDVFGVAKGTSLQLKWSVSNSESVRVEPFGFEALNGEYDFEVNENVEIEIVTKGALKEYSRKIFVYVFPTQVNLDKVATVSPKFLSQAGTIIGESLTRLLDNIDQLDIGATPDGLTKFKEQELARYKDLNKKLGGVGFDKIYAKLHPDRLNQKAREKLKEHYDQRPDYLELLKSLEKDD